MAEEKKALLKADCPRCGADTTTLDVEHHHEFREANVRYFEVAAVCRHCYRMSVFKVEDISHHNTEHIASLTGWYINDYYKVVDVPIVVKGAIRCPDHVPAEIARIFHEAAKCSGLGFYDAAGTMFRKTLDAATRQLIQGEPQSLEKGHPDYISWKDYRDLGLRLGWLFNRLRLPLPLKPLAHCVHQDGNDAAHDLHGIGKIEAEDLGDFTLSLLEAQYTVPGRIADNEKRRAERRGTA